MLNLASCFIPFVNSPKDAQILRNVYSEIKLCRVTVDRLERAQLKNELSGLELWVDSAMDGYDRALKSPKKFDWTNDWGTLFKSLSGGELFARRDFVEKPDKKTVHRFVHELLDTCNEHPCRLLSVPQLPIGQETWRNKLNRHLADSAGTWDNRRRGTQLVLPVVFTKANQYAKERRSKIDRICKYYESAGATMIWVADSDMDDQSGSTPNLKRFENLLNFHVELQKAIPDAAIISGPNWALNLIVWARGLAQYAAISLGSGFRYFPANPILKQGKQRVLLEPLRRLASADRLDVWLRTVLRQLSSEDRMRPFFEELSGSLAALKNTQRTPWQIAEQYRRWLKELEATPPNGRKLALYQHLSSAAVLGSTLPDLSSEKGLAREPEIVAKQLLFNCL